MHLRKGVIFIFLAKKKLRTSCKIQRSPLEMHRPNFVDLVSKLGYIIIRIRICFYHLQCCTIIIFVAILFNVMWNGRGQLVWTSLKPAVWRRLTSMLAIEILNYVYCISVSIFGVEHLKICKNAPNKPNQPWLNNWCEYTRSIGGSNQCSFDRSRLLTFLENWNWRANKISHKLLPFLFYINLEGTEGRVENNQVLKYERLCVTPSSDVTWW